jgi:hypothetical protein
MEPVREEHLIWFVRFCKVDVQSAYLADCDAVVDIKRVIGMN